MKFAGTSMMPFSRHAARREACMLALVVGVLAFAMPDARAQGANEAATIYRLNEVSSFQQGCFPPCLCPIQRAGDLSGTFGLTPKGFDGLFNTYAVTDVNWTATVGDQEGRITGSGTYKVGGEFAVQQQLTLDLTVTDAAVQHFDSGLVPGGGQFPDITATISLHGQVCFDTVFVVDASPVPADQIHPYALLPESTLQRGCFPPCRCALGTPQPMSGRFALVDLRPGPLFTEFAVVNVEWQVDGGPGSPPIAVGGTGKYRVGGEFAVQQQLSLYLTVGEEAPRSFDSGLVVGGGEFPRIEGQISLHGGVCLDTVMDVHADPQPDAPPPE